MAERDRGADLALLRDALTLGQHIDSLTAEVRDLRNEWIRADWVRMKGVEGGVSPRGMESLTAKAVEAKIKYEARLAYREERIASNADYIREKVRNER